MEERESSPKTRPEEKSSLVRKNHSEVTWCHILHAKNIKTMFINQQTYTEPAMNHYEIYYFST